MPSILSIQAGRVSLQPKGDGGTYRTALHKTAVVFPVRVGMEGLEYDEQADRRYHGGPDKAVCCFPSEHFPRIAEFVGREITGGAFGENFTVGGLLESDVCVGDRYRSPGGLVFEVSQPRQPCVNLARRWGRGDLPAWLAGNDLTGWYLRVIRGGELPGPGPLVLAERPHPGWTITRLNALMAKRERSTVLLSEAVSLPQLSDAWRDSFRKRLPKPS